MHASNYDVSRRTRRHSVGRVWKMWREREVAGEGGAGRVRRTTEERLRMSDGERARKEHGAALWSERDALEWRAGAGSS